MIIHPQTKKIQKYIETAVNKANTEFVTAQEILAEIKEGEDSASHLTVEFAEKKSHDAKIELATELTKLATLLREGKEL